MALDKYQARVRLIWSVWRITERSAWDVGVWRRQIVGHNKEHPEVVAEESGLEAARLGKKI